MQKFSSASLGNEQYSSGYEYNTVLHYTVSLIVIDNSVRQHCMTGRQASYPPPPPLFPSWNLPPMRPKAIGLAQCGGPPGWLEESDPAGVILFVLDGPYRLPFPYCTGCPDTRCPAAIWWNFQLLLYSKCINVHKHPSWATSRKKGMARYSSIPMPSLVFHQWPYIYLDPWCVPLFRLYSMAGSR